MPKIVDYDEQLRALSRCAAQLIAERGLEGTTLRGVAEAHGCTKGMVQHYFADKEALLYHSLIYVTDRYRERAVAASRDLAGLALVEARYLALLPLDRERHDEWAVRVAFYARASFTPAMQALLSQHYRRDLRTGIGDLKEAGRRGELRAGVDPAIGYRSVMLVVGGIGLTAVMDPAQLSGDVQKRLLHNAVEALRRH